MRIALLFSPQGSQVVGMGRDLAARSPAAREVFTVADEVLGWAVSSLSWDGPADRLDDTRFTQPCLMAASLAALRALEERIGRVEAAQVAGHSVGEYAAAVAAGALGLEDGLRLVGRRGELMSKAAAEGPPGGMVAVIGLDRARVADVLSHLGDGEVVVANDNAPGQVVVSGTLAAIEGAGEALRRAGAKRVIPLRVSGAFHSPFMGPVSRALGRELERVAWQDPEPPLVSNVTASAVRDAASLPRLLAEQVRSPVEWVASVQHMSAHGVDTFVECGPGAALVGMVRRIVPNATTLNVSDADSLEATAAVLQRSEVAS